MDIITLKNCDNQLKFLASSEITYTTTKNNKITHGSNKQTGDLLVDTSSGNHAHSKKF